MADELDQLIAAVVDGGLVEASQWKIFRATTRYTAVSELADALVDRGLLTRYQAKTLLQEPTAKLVFGNYLLLDHVGGGGMGRVFKAQHRRLKRIVALKMLPPALARSPEMIARFQHEVEAAGKLEHPNIIATYDADEDEGVHFLIMQFVEGIDLAQLVRKTGPLSVGDTLQCLRDAATGLAYAHDRGVVHGDIKPGNLMLGIDGVVRILDMGLAWPASSKTNDGEIPNLMGTIDFLAPERILEPDRSDPRSDLYSLGCTAYYLLTARVPYTGDDIDSKLLAHRQQNPPRLQSIRGDIPDALEAIYQSLVAKFPEERIQTANELLSRLAGDFSHDLSRSTLMQLAAKKQKPKETAAQENGEPSLGRWSVDTPDMPAAETVDLATHSPGPAKRRWVWVVAFGVAAVIIGTFAFQANVSRWFRNHTSVVRGSERDIAHWVISQGGTLQIQQENYWTTISDLDSLPAGQLHIKTVQLGGLENVTDDDLANLRSLDELEMLWLGGTSVTDAGLKHLAALNELRYLSLNDTSISIAGLREISALPQLDTLRLAGTQLRDEDLAEIAAFQQLNALDLSNTSITDDGLRHLERMTNLSQLWLEQTQCSDEATERMRERLPDCDITR